MNIQVDSVRGGQCFIDTQKKMQLEMYFFFQLLDDRKVGPVFWKTMTRTFYSMWGIPFTRNKYWVMMKTLFRDEKGTSENQVGIKIWEVQTWFRFHLFWYLPLFELGLKKFGEKIPLVKLSLSFNHARLGQSNI